MEEYSTALMVDLLRRALSRGHAPTGKYWGVFISTDLCKAVADRLEELQARLDAYETAGAQYEQLVNMLVETVPQLVQAIVERLPQLVEAAVKSTAEEMQEG